VKGILKSKLTSISATPALKDSLVDQLGATRKAGFSGWSTMSYGLPAAIALLLLVMVPYWVWHNGAPDEIFTDAVAQYQRVTRRAASTVPVDSSQAPAARLLDLSPWGYHLLAKQTKEFEGKESRVFVYRGQGKEYLLAQEFEGVDLSSPYNTKTVRQSGRDFVSFNREGVNLVAWREKGVLCILTSTVHEEELLTLAQQIAMGS
jgi:hypothetical protein